MPGISAALRRRFPLPSVGDFAGRAWEPPPLGFQTTSEQGVVLTNHISRRWAAIAVIVCSAGLVSACGGPPPATSWSGLTVSGETAYLASTDRIYAIDTNPLTNNQQRQLWTFPPIGQGASFTFHAKPLVSDEGILYSGSDNPGNSGNFVFALETDRIIDVGEPPNLSKTAETGWRYPSSENQLSLGSIYGGVSANGDSIYAATGKGQIVSFAANPDGQAGQVNWVFTTTQPIWSSPVVSGSVVYVASQDHHLYALDAETGSEIWKFAADAALAGTPTVHGDTVYAGSLDQKLYAVDAASGSVKWEFATQGWLWDGPAVYDNTLYLGDLSGNLYALDLDGREIWTLPSGTELTPSNIENKNKLEGMIRAQPLVTEDRIYLATGAGKLYALERATQSYVWTFPPAAAQGGEQFLTTPVLVGETLLVAPVPSGASPVYLYAINAVSGNAQWLFPPRQEQ